MINNELLAALKALCAKLPQPDEFAYPNYFAKNELALARSAIARAEQSAVSEPVHQWRSKRSAGPWWDGHPDHDDGEGPYETRTLHSAPPAAPPPWQPIETAPKDKAVLVYPATWKEHTASIARWNADQYGKNPRPYWSRDDDQRKVTISRQTPPTHWMPLPPAPTGEKQ